MTRIGQRMVGKRSEVRQRPIGGGVVGYIPALRLESMEHDSQVVVSGELGRKTTCSAASGLD
jgi:hypothetical protein